MSREIGASIARECGIEYEGRSGLIALLHRLGMEHRKPTTKGDCPGMRWQEDHRCNWVNGGSDVSGEQA
jgi:hypothetical protein